MYKTFILFFCINLLHPNFIYEHLTHHTILIYNSHIEDNVIYTINDILSFFSCLRIIPVFTYIFKSIEYNSYKADRIW